jgi:hypothetical protein
VLVGKMIPLATSFPLPTSPTASTASITRCGRCGPIMECRPACAALALALEAAPGMAVCAALALEAAPGLSHPSLGSLSGTLAAIS